jgi:hypothetical protein
VFLAARLQISMSGVVGLVGHVGTKLNRAANRTFCAATQHCRYVGRREPASTSSATITLLPGASLSGQMMSNGVREFCETTIDPHSKNSRGGCHEQGDHRDITTTYQLTLTTARSHKTPKIRIMHASGCRRAPPPHAHFDYNTQPALPRTKSTASMSAPTRRRAAQISKFRRATATCRGVLSENCGGSHAQQRAARSSSSSSVA